jgi:multidrug resistance efflux pump
MRSSDHGLADDTTKDARPDDPARLISNRKNAGRRVRIAPILITFGAVVLGWATWADYMGGPWTRDGTVRAYVVTLAPEVAGRVVELPVVYT